MGLLLKGFFLCTLLSLALGNTNQRQPIVDVGYARYLGNLTFPDSVAYLGIPYAEPPLKNLRFRNPLPLNTRRVQAATGGKVVDATQYPDFCIQGSIGAGDEGGAGSEDCLKVNIYAPASATKDSKLPVLVYIHGGGYVFGNPRNWPFDHWVHQSQELVVVSVYYRLDSFGFLTTPAFSDSSLGDLNAGFNDQIEALRWVKQHISSFGGDPGRVTINGESAGGSSVELHLVANEGEELFQAAIAQSVYRTYVGAPAQREAAFNFYVKAAGCASGGVKEQLACLRGASVSALARAQDMVSNFNASSVGPFHLFTPVIDGKVITANPTKSILEGNFRQVPLVVGATSNETLSSDASLGPPLQAFFPALTNATINKYAVEYPLSAYGGDEARRNTDASGDSELRCARSIMATAWKEKGNTAFTYRFNQANPTSGSITVSHASENWWMFLGTNTGTNGSTTFTAMTPPQTAFAEELIAYWISFVRSHDPNTFKLSRSPEWPQFTLDGLSRIVLQIAQNNSTTVSGSTTERESAVDKARCQFVASIEPEQQN